MLEKASSIVRAMLDEIDELADKVVKLDAALKSLRKNTMPGLGQIKLVLVRKYDHDSSSVIAMADAEDAAHAEELIKECVGRTVPSYVRIGQDAASVLQRVYSFAERTGKASYISVKHKADVSFGEDAKTMLMVCGTKADYYLVHDWAQLPDTEDDFKIDTIVGAGFGKGKMYGKMIDWMEEIL